MTVNDQITLQDINLPEPSIVPTLQLPPNFRARVEEKTNNVLTKISQKTLPDLPEPETIFIDTDFDQGSDTETVNYFEDDCIGKIILEMSDEQQQLPQELLESLTRIGSTPSPPPQGENLLPEINQVNKRETIMINDDSDVDFNLFRTTNGVEIRNNNDDKREVSFVKQMQQHPRDRLARILRNKAPTIEIDAGVLENYPSFTADINIDKLLQNNKSVTT